ncbi:hypothetical protein QBC44DRAFT_376070 [Cladorrhinum sp. PSN332]|nr:hypothetical protein QBC44DRAFT_376070 [Cladorrhinum sp. PSN332]
MTTPKVFVTSATGCQGSAVARQLRSLNWEVHTTTRNPSSPAAASLSALGVHVHQAASWDRGSAPALAAALKNCTHLFLNLMPDLTNETSELAWAKTILSLARSSGVQQVVYSSSFPLKYLAEFAQTPFTLKMRQAKSEIESLISSSAEYKFKTWTILQPGFFMANFLSPKVEFLYPGTLDTGTFTLAYKPDELLPLVDQEDIARFAVAAFREPEKFHGQKITLASEKLAVDEVIKKIAEATGRDHVIKARYLSEEEVREGLAGNPLLAVQKMAEGMAGLVDLDEVRGWGVEMGTFDGFLVREAKGFEETYGSVVSTGVGSPTALGLGISDVATLFSLSKRVGNWLSAASGDRDFLELLDQDELDILRRGGLIGTRQFNKRWGEEMFLLASDKPSVVKGELASKNLEQLTQFTALMICIVGTLDAFCTNNQVRSVVRKFLTEVLGATDYGEDVLASQYSQRINSWRSSAIVRGMAGEARRIRKELLDRDCIASGLIPSGDTPYMVRFLVWLVTDKSDLFQTSSSDVAGVAWCLSKLGADVLGVHGLGESSIAGPIRLQYQRDQEWSIQSNPPVSRLACPRPPSTPINLQHPSESLSSFPVDLDTANRCRMAWKEGQKASEFVACSPLAPESILQQDIQHDDFRYVVHDLGSEPGRVADEIFTLAFSHGFFANAELCGALKETFSHESPALLSWLSSQTLEGPLIPNSSIMSTEMTDTAKINTFTIFQAFFMGYYYGVFLKLVDTSMLCLNIAEGYWGFRNVSFLSLMRAHHLSAGNNFRSKGIIIFRRESIISILSVLLLGTPTNPEAPDKSSGTGSYGRDRWCLGVIDKRALLVQSLVKPCTCPRDDGQFVLLDVDVSGIPVGPNGLVRPGVPDKLLSRVTDGVSWPDVFRPFINNKPLEDATFHIEADWEGDPETILLCVRYRGRRIQTINPAAADRNLVISLQRSDPAADPETEKAEPEGERFTIADLLSRDPKQLSGTREEPKKIILPTAGCPRLRYFIADLYADHATVYILPKSVLQHQCMRGRRGTRVLPLYLAIETADSELSEDASKDWYSKELEPRLRELRVRSESSRFGSDHETVLSEDGVSVRFVPSSQFIPNGQGTRT